MDMSRTLIEAALGIRLAHLSYPVGDKTSAAARELRIAGELGFKTAVTTRPGVLFPLHCNHLMALPRISLNGDHQALRYVRVLLSGRRHRDVERLPPRKRRVATIKCRAAIGYLLSCLALPRACE